MAHNRNTREDIFDTAVELFAWRGYENITMRDIAMAVGIKAASIYNHYKGKQEILNSIYDFYEEHMFMNRLSMSEAKEIIRTGDAHDISAAFSSTKYGTKIMAKRMMLTTKIVYARMFSDDRAKAIFRQQYEMAMQFVREALQYGIDIGRIKPFDTDIYAYSYVAQFVMIGLDEFTKSSYTAHESSREFAIAKFMAEVLPMTV